MLYRERRKYLVLEKGLGVDAMEGRERDIESSQATLYAW